MVSGLHPNPSPDDEHAATVRALVGDLERPDAAPRPWGALASLVTGFISLGALPILLWHDRFRDFVDVERQQLRRFAEWVRLHSSRPETMDLRVAGDDLGTRPMLSVLSLLSVVGVVVLFAAQLGGGGGYGSVVERLIDNTYRFDAARRSWNLPIIEPRQQLFVAWNVGLAVAYLFHWVQVQAHASDVRRLAAHANRVFRGSGMPAVPVPRAGSGFALFWIAAGALLVSKGAWWGIAIALCGATQHRYMAKESARLRRALAARVREMARMPRSGGADGESLGGLTKRCPHVRCLAAMPAGARFCPRCGHNVSPEPGGASLTSDRKSV